MVAIIGAWQKIFTETILRHFTHLSLFLPLQIYGNGGKFLYWWKSGTAVLEALNQICIEAYHFFDDQVYLHMFLTYCIIQKLIWSFLCVRLKSKCNSKQARDKRFLPFFKYVCSSVANVKWFLHQKHIWVNSTPIT